MPPKVHPESFIAENAVIIGEVTIEKGASIWYSAVLRGDESTIIVGEGTNIQDNVIVHTTPTSPVSIGKDCSIGHGAVVHGCTVHDKVIIGINSTILDFAEIHTGAIIGANALVREKQIIPPKSLAVGVPAKVVRENDDELLKAAEENAKQYHLLRDQHMKKLHEKY
ncbi:MAG: gamma carbonic anhydrase family protein [Thermoplasmata archaeon]|nr:MAG: gamma carbonic anhydrase family protein [Thermoplasmata archaeon]